MGDLSFFGRHSQAIAIVLTLIPAALRYVLLDPLTHDLKSLFEQHI